MANPFIPNSGRTKEEMLEVMDIECVDTLFSDIPSEFLIKEDLDIPLSSELELKKILNDLLSKNSPYTKALSFLGGGVWPHHVPEHIKYLTQRSEFLTTYSSFQPEVGQGNLQALFEYQSLISELTGLKVSNSSIYDWASALGEAALMTSRLTGEDKFIVPEMMSPERLAVLRSYAFGSELEIVEAEQNIETGQINYRDLERKVDEETAGVYLENPHYLGNIDEGPKKVSQIAGSEGAKFVMGVNPISLGILKPPADYGADIVVGEGQPLGIPASFGGSTLGIFSCRDEPEFLRNIPGRITGMTSTEDGETRGFCMALQEREQKARREGATSNLCTTQALNAISAAIYLSSLGPSGLREVAKTCAGNAQYMMERMDEIEGVTAPALESHHFNEFVVRFDNSNLTPKEINSELLERGIHGGKTLEKEFPRLSDSSLWCTTEIHTKEEIDWTVRSLTEILEE